MLSSSCTPVVPPVCRDERSSKSRVPIFWFQLWSCSNWKCRYEKGTINYTASQILSDLNQQIGVSVCQSPMAAVMNSTLTIKWTRDPGDRIIVANVIANNEVPLVAPDRRIHEQYPNAIW